MWQFHPISLPLIIGALLSTALAAFAWDRRSIPGAYGLMGLMASVAIWSLAYALELSSPVFRTTIFWLKIEYLGIVSVPVAWSVFAITYTGQDKLISRRTFFYLALIPFVILVLAWTNERHGLIWQEIKQIETAGTLVLEIVHGPGFWVLAIYTYAALLIGSWLLIRHIVRAPTLYQRQTQILLSAVGFPWLANFLYLSNLNPIRPIDLTPFAFMLSGLLLAVGLFHYRFLNLLPIAYQTVFDTFDESLLVLDIQDRVVNVNPAACSLLNMKSGELVGKALEEVFATRPDLIERYRNVTDISDEIITGEEHARRYYQMRILPLIDKDAHLRGRLIIIHEITRHKLEQLYLRQLTNEHKAILEAFPDFYFRFNQEGTILDYHIGNQTSLGDLTESLLGKKIEEIFPVPTGKRFFVTLRQVVSTRSIHWLEYSLQTTQGLRYYEARLLPLGENDVFAVIRDISERKQAQEALIARQRFFLLLNEITLVTLRTTTLDVLLQILADRLGELFNADGCFITLWDETNTQAIPVAAYGPFRESYPSLHIEPGEPTATQAALETQKPLVIKNVHQQASVISPEISAKFPTKDMLALPLIANEEKLGSALIAYNESHEFSSEEIQRGEQVAHQISLAIERVKLLDKVREGTREMEQHYRRQAALAEIELAINQRESLQSLLKHIVELTTLLLPATGGASVVLWDREREVFGTQVTTVREWLGSSGPPKIRKEGSASRWIVDHHKPLVIENIHEDPFPTSIHFFETGLQAFVGMPLLADDQILGVLFAMDRAPRRYSRMDMEFLSAVANRVSTAIRNVQLYEQVQRLARIDGLTGLYNRRHFLELATREVHRATRYTYNLSIIMFDIDHFKVVNDTYGHAVGDQVLTLVAETCLHNLRETDLIGRYGGEEFIVLAPEIDEIESGQVAERLRQAVENLVLDRGTDRVQVTISLGVTMSKAGQKDKDLEELLRLADQALYMAKQAGRNVVKIA